MNDMTPKKRVRQEATSHRTASEGSTQWLRSEIDKLFDQLSRPPGSAPAEMAAIMGLVPPLELTEKPGEYRLTVELPGLARKDIHIDVENGVLTVSGEKKDESVRQEGGALVNERRYGAFARQISLPQDVDAKAVKAKFKKGVLSLKFPKDHAAVANEIPIRT